MKENTLDIYHAETTSELSLPIADEGIKAGFPSPAQDFKGNGYSENIRKEHLSKRFTTNLNDIRI